MVEPRFCNIPPGDDELAQRALELAATTPLELDDWQSFVLENAMLTRPDGNWASKEAGVCVARQNGKNAILEIRELAELFVVHDAMQRRETLVLHSAHEFATATQHFNRLRYLIEETPAINRQLLKNGIRLSHGSEGFYFTGNRSIQFKTRTKGGTRGFSCDLLMLDEAMDLPQSVMAAMFPTKRARPNPQVWYTGSAVDQQSHEHGVTFARVRERGIDEDPILSWFEWSVEGDDPDLVPLEVLRDLAAWKQANPALGIRIDPDGFLDELRALGVRGFAVEILGIGDWPRTDHIAHNPIDYESWAALADDDGVIQAPLVVALDISPERKSAVAIVGMRPDGLLQVEIVESRKGTNWVAPEVVRIAKKHRIKVVCDGRGPAASVAHEIRDLGVEVELLNSTEHGQACGQLMDAVERRSFRHLDDPELNGAVRAAVTRPLGDAWAWSRKDSATNIAPLVSATLALSAAMTSERPRKIAMAWA